MNTIPIKLSDSQFEAYFLSHLSQAKRGFVCSISLLKVSNYILHWFHIGCPWSQLPINHPHKPEISYHGVYHRYRKRFRDGNLKSIWVNSIEQFAQQQCLVLCYWNLDDTHTIAKKGGISVSYWQCKRTKTSNIRPMVDANGSIMATTDTVLGNYNDAYGLVPNLRAVFKFVKTLGFNIIGSSFNGGKAFDSNECCKICFNYGFVPNLVEGKCNCKNVKCRK